MYPIKTVGFLTPTRRPNHRTRWTRRSLTCTEIAPPLSGKDRVVLVAGERTVITMSTHILRVPGERTLTTSKDMSGNNEITISDDLYNRMAKEQVSLLDGVRTHSQKLKCTMYV